MNIKINLVDVSISSKSSKNPSVKRIGYLGKFIKNLKPSNLIIYS